MGRTHKESKEEGGNYSGGGGGCLLATCSVRVYSPSVYKSRRCIKDAQIYFFMCGVVHVSHKTKEMKRCESLINLSKFEPTVNDRYTQQK